MVPRAMTTIRRIKMLALHGMSKDAWKRFSDEGYKHLRGLKLASNTT